MYLVLTYTAPAGYTLVDAVHKITSAAVRPSSLTTSRLILDVSTWIDEAASLNGTPPADVRSFVMENFDANGPDNAAKTSYDWLLTLPEFAGAILVP